MKEFVNSYSYFEEGEVSFLLLEVFKENFVFFGGDIENFRFEIRGCVI